MIRVWRDVLFNRWFLTFTPNLSKRNHWASHNHVVVSQIPQAEVELEVHRQQSLKDFIKEHLTYNWKKWKWWRRHGGVRQKKCLVQKSRTEVKMLRGKRSLSFLLGTVWMRRISCSTLSHPLMSSITFLKMRLEDEEIRKSLRQH